MEKADVRVPIHFFARALHVFGEIRSLENLLDTARDDIGLTLMDERLPKRVRSRAGTSGRSDLMATIAPIRQLGPKVGLRAAELDDFAPAFEHEQMDAAAALLGR